MLRRTVLALMGAVALASTVSAQQAAANLTMEAGRIGPVRARIAEAELKALPFELTTRTVTLEGDPFVEYVVRVDGANTVAATIYQGAAFRVHTRSRAFATPEGAHVGMTLAELQKIYPRGVLQLSAEEAGSMTFYPYGAFGKLLLAFEFSTSGLSLDCLMSRKGEGCPDLSRRPSVSAFTN